MSDRAGEKTASAVFALPVEGGGAVIRDDCSDLAGWGQWGQTPCQMPISQGVRQRLGASPCLVIGRTIGINCHIHPQADDKWRAGLQIDPDLAGLRVQPLVGVVAGDCPGGSCGD